MRSILRTLPIFLLLWSSSAAALLGGRIDDAGRYPSVVALGDGPNLHCSATKIGPDRFLTAAHCVVDTSKGGLDDAFRTRQRLFISNRVEPKVPEDLVAVTVREIRLHPSYEQALRRFYAYKESKLRDYRERYSGEDLARRIRALERDNHFPPVFPMSPSSWSPSPPRRSPSERSIARPCMPAIPLRSWVMGMRASKAWRCRAT